MRSEVYMICICIVLAIWAHYQLGIEALILAFSALSGAVGVSWAHKNGLLPKKRDKSP